jgi:hypothetical protein
MSMPNENKLIAEYNQHVANSDAAGNKFNATCAEDLCCMRDDIDPKALALYWWNELQEGKDRLFSNLSPDERQSLLKLFALDYLTCHAQAIQKRIPSIEEVSGKHEHAPGEEQSLREMVAAGVDGVC